MNHVKVGDIVIGYDESGAIVNWGKDVQVILHDVAQRVIVELAKEIVRLRIKQ